MDLVIVVVRLSLCSGLNFINKEFTGVQLHGVHALYDLDFVLGLSPLYSHQRAERTARQQKQILVGTLANLEGAPPVTLLCSVVGSPSQLLSDLAMAGALGALPAAWLLEALPQSEALGVWQELADKTLGTDSCMLRGCFQLSIRYCVY